MMMQHGALTESAPFHSFTLLRNGSYYGVSINAHKAHENIQPVTHSTAHLPVFFSVAHHSAYDGIHNFSFRKK